MSFETHQLIRSITDDSDEEFTVHYYLSPDFEQEKDTNILLLSTVSIQKVEETFKNEEKSFLQKLTDKFEAGLVVVELRGYGKSVIPGEINREHFHISNYLSDVEQICEYITMEFGNRNWIVVGTGAAGALAIWAKSLNTWDLSFALAFNPSVHLNGQVSGNTLIESPKLQHTLVVFDKPPSEGVKDVVEKTGCEEFVLEREEYSANPEEQILNKMTDSLRSLIKP